MSIKTELFNGSNLETIISAYTDIISKNSALRIYIKIAAMNQVFTGRLAQLVERRTREQMFRVSTGVSSSPRLAN